MALFVLILIAAVIFIVERNYASRKMCDLRYKTERETLLVEKDEEVVLRSSIINVSKLPVSYVRVFEELPDTAELVGPETYVKEHIMALGDKRYVIKNMAIAPHKEIEKFEKYKISNRGVYYYGNHSLITGSFFGLKNLEAKDYTPKHVAVMPSRIEDKKLENVIGGFIGDISVRRFIMEDPILTVGYNEYTGREPMRDISWIRTAVQGKLMVKRYDYTSELRVMILLNLEGGTDADMERTFEICRRVIEELEDKKIPYGFRTNGMIFGPEGAISHMPAGMGEAHFMAMMYGLAGAKHDCWYSLESLVKQTLKGATSNEHYVFVTVPVDEKGEATIRYLESRTGSKMLVLKGEEEREVV